MNIRKHLTLAGLLASALALPSLTGCDTEEELYDELLEGDIEDDFAVEASFRSTNDYFDPVGTHGVASCSTLAGWAKDGDTTAPTQVHIYKDAPFPNGQIVTHVVANKYRGDLPFADKNHGFHMSTPAAFKTGCPEKVYIHAIDLDTNGDIVPGGTNPLLAGTGQTLICGTPPPGGCGFGGDGGLEDGIDIP